MLTITLADVNAAPAVLRPLAGSGAGAFTCDRAQVGSSGSQFAAGLALPRIRGAFGAVRPAQARTADAFGSGYQGRIVGTAGSGVSASNGSTKQHNQMTRIYPAAPGGMGPHPAREPIPV